MQSFLLPVVLNLNVEEISNQDVLYLKETAVDIIIAIFENMIIYAPRQT